MRFIIKRLFTSIFLFTVASASGSLLADNPKVKMDTTEGLVIIELFPEQAPDTVKNFLRYVEAGKYDSTVFHRVIPGFMNQGGGFDQAYKKVDTYAPIKNEATNGLKNKRGTIAMARTGDPHSATNQFFINTVNNQSLDHRGEAMRDWGYCVFGEVKEGMAVMDKIAGARTSAGGPFRSDAPVTPVVIKKMTLMNTSTVNNKTLPAQ